MPPDKAAAVSAGTLESKKRKDPPQASSSSQKSGVKGRAAKRVKTQDARSIQTQTSEAAFKNGELDIQAFLKAREFEIKALEDGMQRSKRALTTRAFQQVPRDMRRRTASHNVKRVPKRLQRRAGKEMKDDNTPTVIPSKKSPGNSRGRLRAETAKRLGILAAKKRAEKAKAEGETVGSNGIMTRIARPKIRKDRLNNPPRPKSKFRKRQIHKTWLPTHLWHAKRATMTEPKQPIWRFAIPITSTEKSYRPTHRGGGARGAVAWDMSYMSTICLEGPVESIEKVLRAMGIVDLGIWEERGERWRAGKRSWSGWLSKEVDGHRNQVGPATIVWCFPGHGLAFVPTPRKQQRKLFMRLHPTTFLEAWTELLRLAKLQRPAVHVEDLRFEIGSIEVTGPGSTEALIGILHPYQQGEGVQEEHAHVFKSLAGVTNPASLPPNSLLSFSIMDPRLRLPPRQITTPKPTDEEANFRLLQLLSDWPVDSSTPSSALFDRNSRFKATHLPSQKSLNRRKALAPPGSLLSNLQTDPQIPVMLLASRARFDASSQGSWTLLAPWKCILPIWYGLMHYPLSSGGNPRFGGLEEIRQVHLERGVPWFPADYPGTNAGFAWEVDERQKRKIKYDSKPRGKRVEWETLDLGAGRSGEIGNGWASDFEELLRLCTLSDSDTGAKNAQKKPGLLAGCPNLKLGVPIEHLPTKSFTSLLSSPDAALPPSSTVAVIRISLLSRGVANPCARIYRLPLPKYLQSTTTTTIQPNIRQQWLTLLALISTKSKPRPNEESKPTIDPIRIPLNTPLPQRIRLLAQSLLRTPPLPYPADTTVEDGHPLVPDEEDLIGFVTTGQFNLAEGKGVAIGSVIVKKTIQGLRADWKESKHGRLCVIRNAGERIGRLGRWEAA